MHPIHRTTSARRELTDRGWLAAEGDGRFGQRYVENVMERKAARSRGDRRSRAGINVTVTSSATVLSGFMEPREDLAARARRRLPGAPARSGADYRRTHTRMPTTLVAPALSEIDHHGASGVRGGSWQFSDIMRKFRAPAENCSLSATSKRHSWIYGNCPAFRGGETALFRDSCLRLR